MTFNILGQGKNVCKTDYSAEQKCTVRNYMNKYHVCNGAHKARYICEVGWQSLKFSRPIVSPPVCSNPFSI